MGLGDFYQIFLSISYGLLLKFPLQVQSPCRVILARKGDSAVPEQCWAIAVVQHTPPHTLVLWILLLQTYDSGSKEFGGSVHWFLQQPHLLIGRGNLEISRSMQKQEWCTCAEPRSWLQGSVGGGVRGWLWLGGLCWDQRYPQHEQHLCSQPCKPTGDGEEL